MPPPFVQQILLFLLPFAVTLVIGGGNYLLMRLAYDKVPDFAEGSSFPCMLLLLVLVSPFFAISVLLFPPTLFLLPLSFLATYADQKISTEQDAFSWHYWRICVAVVFSLVDALLLYIVALRMGLHVPALSGLAREGLIPVAGCLVGFLAGPVMAPIWILAYRRLNAFWDQHPATNRQFK